MSGSNVQQIFIDFQIKWIWIILNLKTDEQHLTSLLLFFLLCNKEDLSASLVTLSLLASHNSEYFSAEKQIFQDFLKSWIVLSLSKCVCFNYFRRVLIVIWFSRKKFLSMNLTTSIKDTFEHLFESEVGFKTTGWKCWNYKISRC